jgi:hypothetical protein
MHRMEMMQTGSATKNHTPQLGSGDMFCKAMRFWGEAMGEAAPPMLEERAMPRRSALVMSESAGRFRRMGLMCISYYIKVESGRLGKGRIGWERTWMMEKQSTGAATLLIHMLANMATNMFVSSTVRGFVPALLSTKVAIIFAMLYFDSAAAIVKPPRRSMMTGVHMAAKT